MSTSDDDHNALSDSDFIDYPAIGEHYDDHDHHSHRARSLALLPIPDLRFEQSYLNSIKAFVHIEQTSIPNEERPDIGRDVIPIVDSSHQLVRISWGRVVWATTRDQIVSPLVQGALWYASFLLSQFFASRRCYNYRGLASGFIRPFFSLVGSHLRGFFPRLPSHKATSEPGWWKWWTHGLGLRTSSPGSGNGIGRW